MTERIEELLERSGIKCIPDGEGNSTEHDFHLDEIGA